MEKNNNAIGQEQGQGVPMFKKEPVGPYLSLPI